MADFNKEALAIWNSIKPVIDKEIDRKTDPMVQRRKVAVSTAPNPSTGLIGVKEPFGPEFFVPYRNEVSGVAVGDTVWIEFAYGANNAIAIGTAGLVEPRRICYAETLSSAGWYRIMTFENSNSMYNMGATGVQVDFHIGRRRTTEREEIHDIKMLCLYDSVKFVDELSAVYDTSYFRIDKIRYTYSSTNGYVDIHILSECPRIRADFDVHCEPTYQSLYTANNFVAVADSPTGETVLETYNFTDNVPAVGSNANGTYVKYPDGTLICTKTVNFGDISSWTAWGGWYETSSTYDAGDWPMEFVAVPTMTATQVQTGANINFAGAEMWMDRTTLKIGKAYFYRPSTTTVYSITYDFIGIGRWK